MMMHILYAILFIVSPLCASQPPEPQSFAFQVTPKQHAAIKVLLVVVGDVDSTLSEIAALIKKDVEFSKQFTVTTRSCAHVSTKAQLKEIAHEGFSLALFINDVPHQKALEWRLYDTQQAEMISGKKYHKRGALARGWAHQLADAVWQELTAQPGFFSTKIAYCKEVRGPRNKQCKHIYVADYDGSNEQLVVSTPTINMAPRFNQDQQKPVLFYSESTPANIRLMLVDMHKTRKIASNFDGINMLPSFSGDGSKLVYCASHGNGNCQLFYYEKGIFKQVTKNNGNNISPSLSADGARVFYCSDYAGKPQIYCHDLKTGHEKNISSCNESCFSPNYYSKKGLLAYVKTIKGTMQLCLFDESTGKHQQLTFDEGNKDECSWSPCGNYLLYSVEKNNKGRICMLNVLTQEQKFITASNTVCSYPTWSPVYGQYVAVA